MAFFSPEAPRKVPGRRLGTILDGSGSYFCVFLTLCLMFFWLPRDSQESPWEGVGNHFRRNLELSLTIFDLICYVFLVECMHCFLYGICMECV